MKKLTAKQQRFVDEYLVDLNGAAAAERAGYSKGDSARVTAIRILKKPLVKKYLAERTKARLGRIEISQDKVINEIARVAFSDIRKTMKWGPDGVKLLDSEDLTDDQAAAVAEVAETVSKEGGSLKLKKHDKLKALELLGRHLGMFVDKHEHTGKDGAPLPNERIVIIGREEAAQIGAELDAKV